MITRMTKLFLVFAGVLDLTQALATDAYPFFLQRQDGSLLEGYFSPPCAMDAPIIFAIQGSSCESVLKWHRSLSDQVNALGLGVITLEKQGVSRASIDCFAYSQTNCLQNRLEDYIICLQNTQLICPEWEGKLIFWGESEGGSLAASLASQTPQTAAVLLFCAGGGMQPREEVKWALQHRLEKQGVHEDEVDDYIHFLDEQMDAMILDPTSQKQFLGNTYKWWASFLALDKLALSLHQQCLPICLIHGVVDDLIPILSADLAAEDLAKTNAVTYLRLEGYGHDLGALDVQNATNNWLGSVLFGRELLDQNLYAPTACFVATSVQEVESGMSAYIFSRGIDRGNRESDGGGRGEVYGSVRGDKDSRGNEGISVDAGGRYRSDNGWNVEANAGGSFGTDKEGNAKGEGHVEVEVSYEF